jgi:hypothetical protein
MRQIWIPMIVTVAIATALRPGPVLAGEDCWSKGGCGQVHDGLDSHLSRYPVNWKCVKGWYRPMFPALPVCPEKMIKMDKPVPMPITFSAPATPGKLATPGTTQGK